MTVYIATLFRWNYAPKGQPADHGVVALVASDRMITAGDAEYEPQQLKVAFIAPKIIILIAGEYPVHTQAIGIVVKQLRGMANTVPETVAVLYGRALQSIRLRQAEDIYLAPLGMNTDTFTAQQGDMSEGFVSTVMAQLQGFEGPSVEALIVGADDERAQIWSVDYRGTARCFDDVGFHAIGIGAGHASYSLMQAGYTNTWFFANSLAATYAAKKIAETAPGVGTNTDIHLVTKHNVTPLWPNAFQNLERIYAKYREAHGKLVAESITELQESMKEPESVPTLKVEGGQSVGENAETNGGSRTDSAEVPR